MIYSHPKGGCKVCVFTIKLGEKWHFWLENCPPIEVCAVYVPFSFPEKNSDSRGHKQRLMEINGLFNSDLIFSLHPPAHPDNPPPSHPRELDSSPFRVRFGSVSVRFGSVWIRFGSVSGSSWGVGSGWGGVVERGFCKGKEYHYSIWFPKRASSGNDSLNLK